MNWRRSAAGMGIALPIVGLLAFGMTRDPNKIPSTMPGKVAPEFALTIMDAPADDTVRLTRRRGDIVVLNFWASWCLECRYEHSDLSMIAALYQPKGVQFYGILYKDSPANARVWIREQGGQTYPTLVDPGSRTAVDYALTGVPETVIIGMDGRVAHKRIGAITAAELTTVLDSLVAARTATVSRSESQ